MNSLTITQKPSETERYIPKEVITTLYNIGKDDDEHQTLTSGVDTTDANRPVTSVVGSVAVRVAYANQIEYLATKFPNLNISTDATYIYFADSEVERVLLANGIGDGVGVSAQDASQATISSNMFQGNSTIVSFDEFGYFTKANTNPQDALFKNCTALSRIDLSNVSTISQQEFMNTALSGDIVLPQLSAIGSNAFNGTNITSIDLTGSSISALPSGVFQNCSSLSKISIPTSVTYLYDYWGDGIESVVTLEGFNNCASHSQNNWQLCNKTILNPIKTSFVSESYAIMQLSSNNITINYNQLYNPSITSIGPGRCLSNYQFYTYFTSRVTGGASRVNIGLLYFRDISSFGALTFYKCNINNLVINNVTPPTLNYSANASDRYYREAVWNNNIFPTGNSDQNNNVVIGTLWVPDSAVATYQADPLYSHLNIKGINTKTNGTDYDLPRYATYAAWKAAEEAAVAQGGHAVTGIIEEYM